MKLPLPGSIATSPPLPSANFDQVLPAPAYTSEPLPSVPPMMRPLVPKWPAPLWNGITDKPLFSDAHPVSGVVTAWMSAAT